MISMLGMALEHRPQLQEKVQSALQEIARMRTKWCSHGCARCTISSYIEKDECTPESVFLVLNTMSTAMLYSGTMGNVMELRNKYVSAIDTICEARYAMCRERGSSCESCRLGALVGTDGSCDSGVVGEYIIAEVIERAKRT